MRRRDFERMMDLIHQWVGEVGAQTVREQLPQMTERYAEEQMSAVIKRVADKRLWDIPEFKLAERVVSDAVQMAADRALGDPAWIRERVDEEVSTILATSLLNYSDQLHYLRCKSCGQRHENPVTEDPAVEEDDAAE